jgi:hypothetical protein
MTDGARLVDLNFSICELRMGKICSRNVNQQRFVVAKVELVLSR